jgi:hypothetical protein
MTTSAPNGGAEEAAWAPMDTYTGGASGIPHQWLREPAETSRSRLLATRLTEYRSDAASHLRAISTEMTPRGYHLHKAPPPFGINVPPPVDFGSNSHTLSVPPQPPFEKSQVRNATLREELGYSTYEFPTRTNPPFAVFDHQGMAAEEIGMLPESTIKVSNTKNL